MKIKGRSKNWGKEKAELHQDALARAFDRKFLRHLCENEKRAVEPISPRAKEQHEQRSDRSLSDRQKLLSLRQIHEWRSAEAIQEDLFGDTRQVKVTKK